MSFWAIIETILIKPLQLLFEIIYMTAYDFIGDPGLTIIVLSLVMNFLVLPLYKRADAMQEEEQAMEKRLRKGVAHIKKTFSGDEKMMMLQTYYRQNNYKPTYVLRSAVSLFLEIPFFMAAYAFLSKLQLLEGVAFGPIADLGKPDGMLLLGGLSVNVLPFVMTAVNLVSCAIFTKGSTLNSKLQLYGMAIFFLVFLYDSPSGLVFYWTLNNVFSLVKTIFYKLKNPGRILSIMSFAAGLVLLAHSISRRYPKEIVFFAGCGILLLLPLIVTVLKSRMKWHPREKAEVPNQTLFFSGTVFLAILTGLLIPSSVINASPQEFVSLAYFHHPNWFVLSASCLALGTFVVWGGVFYWLAKPSSRVLFEKAIWIFCGTALVNYLFFGKDLGLLSSTLKFQDGLNITWKAQLQNLVILIAVGFLLYLFFKNWKKKTVPILAAFCLAMSCMSVLNVANITNSIDQIKENLLAAQDEKPEFTLSKSGKNVVVVMLDMAMGQYIPYIFNEKPELVEQFDGFTYYSNVVSFGGHTVYGAPALFGGYEYTPYEMNRRSDATLIEKHNEALKVMPVLFHQNQYQVTVTDLPFVNYQEGIDFSIFDDYPEIRTYSTIDSLTNPSLEKQSIPYKERNFFCYGLLKSLPLCLQEGLYDEGTYRQGNSSQLDATEDGVTSAFMSSYSVLDALPQLTQMSDNSSNQFLLLTNETTHEGVILQKPDYRPSLHVDNSEFESPDSNQRHANGKTLDLTKGRKQEKFYHVNMAAMLRLGKWFDYMRQNDVYDNTRIILVSDHGASFENFDELILEDGVDASFFYPLLMVKDFGSTGFTVSEEFMTNGDVPALAANGIIPNPANPFTGNQLNSKKKSTHNQYVFGSHKVKLLKNGETSYLPSKWYSVHDNIWDKDNWEVVAENAVLSDVS